MYYGIYYVYYIIFCEINMLCMTSDTLYYSVISHYNITALCATDTVVATLFPCKLFGVNLWATPGTSGHGSNAMVSNGSLLKHLP